KGSGAGAGTAGPGPQTKTPSGNAFPEGVCRGARDRTRTDDLYHGKQGCFPFFPQGFRRPSQHTESRSTTVFLSTSGNPGLMSAFPFPGDFDPHSFPISFPK